MFLQDIELVVLTDRERKYSICMSVHIAKEAQKVQLYYTCCILRFQLDGIHNEFTQLEIHILLPTDDAELKGRKQVSQRTVL